jgi:imidazolonepropionase-like amidohydrolase
MTRRPLTALPLALLAVSTAAVAQTADPGKSLTAPKADYALTNVRIVTAPGKVIENGTIITRDGRIAAVGAGIAIPAGVVRMDLAGNTVYAGLIDAATSIGLPSPTRPLAAANAAAAGGQGGRGGAPAGAGGRGGAPVAGGAAAPAPVTELPELDATAEAADQFQPTDDQLKAFRAGGVTTVGLVFNGGIFPGRVGAALTAQPENSRLSLRPSAGQVVSFGTKRGGYPGTLIGSMAFIKQAYLDAQYEARIEKAFKAGTPGARPTNDPFRRALIPAANGEISSWFLASSERQISRVADIATEIGIKNPVVVGSQEGWRSIANLKRAGATAVVSVQFVSPDSVTGREFLAVGSGKTGTAPAATAADSNEVRANAAALAKAGIPVAFSSFGGASGTTFRDRIKQAIAAGLSADDALKAATVTPAAVLGVTAAVGTIEVGKLANFLVVTGNDAFASPIKHVFIEGRLY